MKQIRDEKVRAIYDAAKAAKWTWISTVGTGREGDPFYYKWHHEFYGTIQEKLENIENAMVEAKRDFYAIPDKDLIEIYKEY